MSPAGPARAIFQCHHITWAALHVLLSCKVHGPAGTHWQQHGEPSAVGDVGGQNPSWLLSGPGFASVPGETGIPAAAEWVQEGAGGGTASGSHQVHRRMAGLTGPGRGLAGPRQSIVGPLVGVLMEQIWVKFLEVAAWELLGVPGPSQRDPGLGEGEAPALDRRPQARKAASSYTRT